MVKLMSLAVLCIVGYGAWNLGHALSQSSVDMAFGVIVGTFAGVPPLLLIAHAISQGAGRPAPPQRMTIEVVHRVALPEPPTRTIDGTLEPRYTAAHPFAIAPAHPNVIHVPPADDDCPDWCEPWIWEELYDNGKSAPQHESLQERRYRVDWSE